MPLLAVMARVDASEFVLSLLAGAFLIAYGLGVAGWPYDVTRGVKMLERMSPRRRRVIGGVVIAAGVFLIVSPLW